jgi:membrane protein YqaA with SNARE-associated domain
MQNMKTQTAKLYAWATEKAASKKAPYWIGILFLLELVLFIPLDAVLMFFCLQNPKKTFLYVLIAALASSMAGMMGYLFGHFLWDWIGPVVVPHLIAASSFDRVAGHFHLYEHWALFVGSLLPLPLKVLSLAAGVFHFKLFPVVVCILAARLLRFGLVGGAMLIWGESVKQFLDRHFHRVAMVIGAKIAAAFLFFWSIAQ